LLLATSAAFAAATPSAHAGVFVSVNIAPPALPVYVQPPIPGPGYIWTPGYWAYDEDGGYYWVPGTWVQPPCFGALWTPAYWGWEGGVYVFHTGYWGRHVGYYGGINYGFGYVGVGYLGGYWGPHGFFYNRTVNHITNVNITNVYNKTVINNTVVNRASFNGPGGVTRRPTEQEAAYSRETHTPAVAAQAQHQALAGQNQSLRASVNHGAPSVAATPRPGAFAAASVSASHAALIGQPTHSPSGRAALSSTTYAPHAAAPGDVRRASTSNHTPTMGGQRILSTRPNPSHTVMQSHPPQAPTAMARNHPANSAHVNAPRAARSGGESDHRH